MRYIDELHLEHPFLGARILRDQLNRMDIEVGHKHVKALIKKMGVEAFYRKPNTSIKHPNNKIYLYLLRDQIINRASRKVLTAKIAITLEATHAVEVLKEAFRRHGRPEIVNTDQGSQFTSHEFVQTVKDLGCRLSMDGRGAWRDNVFVECLWKTVKYERVYLYAYDTVAEARASIMEYLDWYNRSRPHSKLNKRTPDEAYGMMLPTINLAA